MVENKCSENRCSRCGNDVDYVIPMLRAYSPNSNRETLANTFVDIRFGSPKVIEHWCLPCLFRKAPVMGNRET